MCRRCVSLCFATRLCHRIHSYEYISVINLVTAVKSADLPAAYHAVLRPHHTQRALCIRLHSILHLRLIERVWGVKCKVRRRNPKVIVKSHAHDTHGVLFLFCNFARWMWKRRGDLTEAYKFPVVLAADLYAGIYYVEMCGNNLPVRQKIKGKKCICHHLFTVVSASYTIM